MAKHSAIGGNPEICTLDPNRPPPRTWAVWLATGGGIGLVSPAPGTVGALIWGMPLAWAIGLLPVRGWQLIALLLVNLIGVPLCTRAGRDLGGRKDPQAIVWDEITSVPVVFLLVPLSSWRVGLVGFLALRFLDILKPPPARWFERLREGLGVMADDWVAAIYAAATLWLIRVFVGLT